jgi:ATP-GRASP peptide maturase of grasp-with-spasm system
MILVLSYDNYEQGTEYVIDWLVHYKAGFVKITVSDFFSFSSPFELDICNNELRFEGKNILPLITVIFYRRLFNTFHLNDSVQNVFKDQIEKEVTEETISLVQYLFYLSRHKTWLPSPAVVNVNKLIMLDKALKAGLETPASVILNNKKALRAFFTARKENVITKPIAKSGYFIVNNHTYFSNVDKLSSGDIDTIDERFFPSLFQENIDKEYEIRVFYLDRKFFCLALLTSDHDWVDVKLKTGTDTAHWVVYKLPSPVEKKIIGFMDDVGLNTGSLDIIKTSDGRYVFLEVNPVGQYSHPSYHGNFMIEREIAKWLIKKDSEHGKRN